MDDIYDRVGSILLITALVAYGVRIWGARDRRDAGIVAFLGGCMYTSSPS